MSHTPGKLKTSYTHIRHVLTEHGAVLAVCSNDQGLTTTQANARRLVAAWNACEGISTNTLEAIRSPIKDISCVPGLVADIDALRAVNAELVEACQELLEVYGIDDVRRWMALREQARAALAKAKELKGTP